MLFGLSFAAPMAFAISRSFVYMSWLNTAQPDDISTLFRVEPHFTAAVFATLAEDETFVHVVIARHRPQSNGIAERFVRTLKAWLRDKDWQDEQALADLLGDFLREYNDRPHQGLPIPGLSPNEFAARIGLM